MADVFTGMGAYAYARVSTDDHDQNPEVQLIQIRKWCNDQGVILKAEFSDHISGGEITRTGLSEMLGRLVLEPVHLVVMLSPDRLTRDMHDSDRLLAKFQDMGVVIRYVTSDIKTETQEGQLIHYMNAYSAEKFRTDNKVKVLAGLEKARLSGKLCHRPAVPIDVNKVLDYARSGLTMSSMSPLFVYKLQTTNKDGTPIIRHASREHIRKALLAAGKMDEYNTIRKEVRK